MAKVNNDIRSIDFPESIRTRPVMYMGEVNNSNHALTEMVDNVMDHIFRDKSLNKVFIKTCSPTKKNDYILVANNGVSFPINQDDKRPKTKADLSATHMHTGSNFDGKSTSIGQNGIGLKGANALSEYFYIITKIVDDAHLKSIPSIKAKGKNGQYYFLRYHKGVKTHEDVSTLSKISKIDKIKIPSGYKTIVISRPDTDIYEEASATIDASRLESALLLFKNFYNRSIKITLDDNLINISTVGYKYRAKAAYKIPGIAYSKTKLVHGKKVPDTSSRRVEDKKNMVELKFLADFEFSSDFEGTSETGNINTRPIPKGIHIKSVKDLIGLCLKEVFDIKHNYLTKGIVLNSLVLAPGSHLQLSGQTKDSLLKIRYFKHDVYTKSGAVNKTNDWSKLKYQIKKVIQANKKGIEPHVLRLNEYAMSLNKLASKDYIQGMLTDTKDNLGVIKIHTDHMRNASSSDRSKCSLFIVEGKSAASSLLDARDPEYHAIFTMRGYGLNTVKKPLKVVFKNKEYNELIIGINAGVDIHNDLSGIQFEEIVIATDADPDGLAIASLILCMFGQHMKFMLDSGRVYVNESPLYYQNGNYFRSYERGKLDLTKPYTRFKGLGELNSEQAHDVFFGKHKKLIRITSDDVAQALELLDSSSDAKKKWLEKNKVIKIN